MRVRIRVRVRVRVWARVRVGVGVRTSTSLDGYMAGDEDTAPLPAGLPPSPCVLKGLGGSWKD